MKQAQAMNKVYIGLGSNLESPIEQLQLAIEQLQDAEGIHNLEVSALYRSKPVGPQDQPDFVNAAAFFQTELEPLHVLDTLQHIEQLHHRVRLRHWGPRTLDLDLLLYNDDIIELPRLTVPHPYMLERGFVLKPLADLAPNLMLQNGKTLVQQLELIDTSDLVLI